MAACLEQALCVCWSGLHDGVQPGCPPAGLAGTARQQRAGRLCAGPLRCCTLESGGPAGARSGAGLFCRQPFPLTDWCSVPTAAVWRRSCRPGCSCGAPGPGHGRRPPGSPTVMATPSVSVSGLRLTVTTVPWPRGGLAISVFWDLAPGGYVTKLRLRQWERCRVAVLCARGQPAGGLIHPGLSLCPLCQLLLSGTCKAVLNRL